MLCFVRPFEHSPVKQGVIFRRQTPSTTFSSKLVFLSEGGDDGALVLSRLGWQVQHKRLGQVVSRSGNDESRMNVVSVCDPKFGATLSSIVIPQKIRFTIFAGFSIFCSAHLRCMLISPCQSPTLLSCSSSPSCFEDIPTIPAAFPIRIH